jgi:hypothetical protein
MEPVSMILGALVMGMSAVAKDVGGQIVKDSYNALKRLITDRYKRAGAIAALEEDPTSETQQKALEEALTKADAVKDAEVLQMARALSQALAQVPPASLASVGVRIAEVEALNARFANIEVAGGGTGVEIGKVKTQEDFTVENIKVRGSN